MKKAIILVCLILVLISCEKEPEVVLIDSPDEPEIVEPAIKEPTRIQEPIIKEPVIQQPITKPAEKPSTDVTKEQFCDSVIQYAQNCYAEGLPGKECGKKMVQDLQQQMGVTKQKATDLAKLCIDG